MSERLRRAYERKEKSDRKVRIRATDPSRAEQQLMGEVFKQRNPDLYPGYKMPTKVREQLASLGLLAAVGFSAGEGLSTDGEPLSITWSLKVNG